MNDPMSEPTLSQKYRSFVASSIFRVVITRSLSLIYFATFYRLIGGEKADLGTIVLLSIGLMVTGNFSDFGLYYAFTQWSLREEIDFNRLCEIVFSSFFVFVLPISLFSSLILGIAALGDLMISLLLYSVASMLNSAYFLVIRFLYATMEMERVNLMLGSYSVLNSILTPVLYYFYRSLDSVLLAWILSFLGTLLISYRSINKMLRIFRVSVDFGLMKEMMVFGFPIFVTGLIRLLSNQFDRFLVYFVFDPETLGVYTTMKRMVEILNEAILVFLTGLYPIFSKLGKRDEKRGVVVFLSLLRFISLITVLVFMFFYLNREWMVHLLIGTAYDAGLPLLSLLILGQIVITLASLLEQYALGLEKRFSLLIGSLLVIMVQTTTIVLLKHWGPIAIVL